VVGHVVQAEVEVPHEHGVVVLRREEGGGGGREWWGWMSAGEEW